MAQELRIKRQQISFFHQRSSRNKTSLSTCINQNNAKNDEEENKSEMGSGQRRRCKAIATTQLSYDLMLAITPWVGNVIMPLPYSERRVCEGNFKI